MEFRGKIVPVLNDEKGKVCSSLLFKEWLSSLDEEVSLLDVKVINFKENEKGILTYLKLSVVTEMKGHKIPRFLFLEGPSIAVIAFRKNENNEISVFLEEKPFVASGKVIKCLPYKKMHDFDISEIKAKEIIDEKLGVFIEEKKFINLLKNVNVNCEKSGDYVLPLPGNSDDRCYYYIVDVSNERLDNNSLALFYPIDKVIKESGDFVTKTGLLLLNKYVSSQVEKVD